MTSQMIIIHAVLKFFVVSKRSLLLVDLYPSWDNPQVHWRMTEALTCGELDI